MLPTNQDKLFSNFKWKSAKMLYILLVSTFILAAMTLLPLMPSNHWICRVWEFPRVQISALLLANSLAILYLLPNKAGYLLLVISIALLIYQLIWVVPFTKLGLTQVKSIIPNSDMLELKLLTSNVLMSNHSVDKLVALIKQYEPDVIVTLETNLWWQNALEVIHADYPYRVAEPLDNLYGMHVYSKYALSNVRVLNLIKDDIPSIHCDLHLCDHTFVKCHFIHPEPPSPTESETAKPRDKELLLVADMVNPKEYPTIVSGDLNDVAWSPTTRAFRKKSGLLDPRLGRGFFNTFHAQYPLARWPLDHIFHSDHLKLIEIKRLASIDSDHFPLYSSFAINK
jgi:endonuclease/exonuclease/phosphatase (EEP) superfamily protein YafD